MERILNDDEKIRRAQEIYYRRNNQNLPVSNRITSKEKGSFKNKFFLHLLIMFNIAVLVFAIQNKEYIFTQEFLGAIEQYNVNISLHFGNRKAVYGPSGPEPIKFKYERGSNYGKKQRRIRGGRNS